MRRNSIINKKVIILVILSGFFNLLSFTFDQLVVQSELKTRDLDRRIIASKTSIDETLIKIDTLSDLSYDISNSTMHFYNYFEIIQANAYFFSNKNNLNDLIKKNIFNEEQTNIVRKDFIFKFNKMITDFNKKLFETKKIFISIEPDFTKYTKLENYKLNKDILLNWKFEKKKDEDEESVLNHNYGTYSKIYSSIQNLEYVRSLSNWYIQQAENIYVQEFSNFLNLIDKYSKQQNNINYFILLSIICQILGIFFILVLFKTIIIKKLK